MALAGVSLRPLDRLVLADRGDGSVASGDTIRVIRVSDAQTVAQEPVAFEVKTVSDASLPLGRVAVATAGIPGVAQNTYSIRTADGVEESRTLLVSVELRAPVAEVRRVGTLVPAPAGDIQGIIRAAAGRWGADETQLLRVAYCESLQRLVRRLGALPVPRDDLGREQRARRVRRRERVRSGGQRQHRRLYVCESASAAVAVQVTRGAVL